MSKRRRRRPTKTNAPRTPEIDENLVSVVIPVYNRLELLEQCLDALEEAKGDTIVEVVIVDDGSKPPARSIDLKKWNETGIPIRIVTNSHNRGFPFSMNRGVQKSSGKLVLSLNSDVVLAKDAIEILVDEFDTNQIGVVGAKLLFPADSTDPHRPADTIQHAGLVIGFDGKPIHIHMGWPKDHPRANVHREMQLMTGACMMFRREIFDAMGGFAEIYGRGTYEDMEFCVGARLRGFMVMYQPMAWGYHYAGGSVTENHNFPLQENLMLWKLRCGNFVYWDEWRFW